MFKWLNHINDNFYDVEMAKAEIEHKEPNIVGFFILQYAKMRRLELDYNFFYQFCEKDKYEELEMDTDLLYLALAETNVCDCINEDKNEVWEFLGSRDCNDDSAADACCKFSTHMLQKAQETPQERTGSFQGGVPVHRNVVSL